MMGGKAAGNVEIMTYQEITKDRLFEFTRIYDNIWQYGLIIFLRREK